MNRLFIGLIALTLPVGCNRPSATAPPPSASTPAAAVQTGTVTIEIEVDGTVESLIVPDVADGTSLETIMQEVKLVPVKMRGSGTTAFVESIAGKDTSGAEGWTFLVDGEFAQQGVGTTALSPPTTVTWKYGDFSDQQP